jgi:TDG/mug DNA glycosylase family protein
VKEALPDLLARNMTVVFCGTAAGTASARRAAYYAGPNNIFWKTLHEIGLTPTRFAPEQYREVKALGIGFTDLAKGISGNDNVLHKSHFEPVLLRRKILRFRPRVVAFTSKRAATEFIGRPA